MVVSRPTKVQYVITATCHPSGTTSNLLLINILQRLVAEWQQRVLKVTFDEGLVHSDITL